MRYIGIWKHLTNDSDNQSFILLSSHHYDFLRTKGLQDQYIYDECLETFYKCLETHQRERIDEAV